MELFLLGPSASKMLHSSGLRSRKSSTSSAQHHREALQLRTQADWAGREYIDLMSGSIKRIADFLNAFHLSCSSRLAELNSRYMVNMNWLGAHWVLFSCLFLKRIKQSLVNIFSDYLSWNAKSSTWRARLKWTHIIRTWQLEEIG